MKIKQCKAKMVSKLLFFSSNTINTPIRGSNKIFTLLINIYWIFMVLPRSIHPPRMNMTMSTSAHENLWLFFLLCSDKINAAAEGINI